MWVLLDNYDSFTHILHHYLLLTGHECVVLRNDEVSVSELAAINPSRLIISPGPQTPLQAGISLGAIAHFYDKIPILGICLGHQALGMFFGATLVHLPVPMHGKTSNVAHNNDTLFTGINSPFEVMRYHSLAIDLQDNSELVSIAQSLDDHVVMSCAHKSLPLTGIQFHPESIGTLSGQVMLNNWANSFQN